MQERADPNRLATYGTLAPGQPNHHQLDGLRGSWSEGVVHGRLLELGWGAGLGYPGLALDAAADAVAVHVFTSDDLPDHWTRLDEFEGEEYERVIARVSTPGGPLDAYLYVARG